jgi:uncharacterized protein YciI
MLFIVRFHDREEALALRHEHLQAHLDWLAANESVVRIAGSLREDPVLPPVGALWIVEATSREAVQALIATDPFSVAGLRERVEILHWSKAFPGRAATI